MEAHSIKTIIGSVSNDHFGNILECVSHKSDVLIIEYNHLLLNIPQYITLWDYAEMGTRGIYSLFLFSKYYDPTQHL